MPLHPLPGPDRESHADTGADASVRPGFVALSRFVIANDMAAEAKAAFRDRPHLVDQVPGFARMDVISPQDRPEETWLLTLWTDQASFQARHHSVACHASHRGIPHGLKLLPGETSRAQFDDVSS